MVKQKMLYFEMRSFNHAHINESTLHIVDDKMKFFEDAFIEFMEGIASLLRFLSDSLDADKVRDWNNVWSSTIKDTNEYRRNVFQKANAVKENPLRSAPMHGHSQVTTSMIQKEQLEEMRRHNDLLERSQHQQEKENERKEKFNETLKMSQEKLLLKRMSQRKLLLMMI